MFIITVFPCCALQGLTLENIEVLYSKPWKERVQILHYVKCLCFREVLSRTIPDSDQAASNSEGEQSIDAKKQNEAEDEFTNECEKELDDISI